jgi:nucleoid-associated protein YgaU
MRRNVFTTVATLLALVTLGGCSLFGKKKDATVDTYDPATEAAAGGAEAYSAYPAAGGYGTSTAGGRSHTVQKKETLYAIARQYYNDQSRWKDIYEANRADISDPNRIRVGQRLVIP